MSRGYYSDPTCHAGVFDIGRYRVSVEFWTSPRFWSVGVTRFTVVACGWKASLGPLEIAVARRWEPPTEARGLERDGGK
jgi:hypothetical protein